jgi:hypothetical protein
MDFCSPVLPISACAPREITLQRKYMKPHLFVYDAHIKSSDTDKKRKHFESVGYTFVGELSPEEATLPVDGKMGETVLRFTHPLSW